MSALDRLRQRLERDDSSVLNLTVGGELPKLIQALERHVRRGSALAAGDDLIKKSIGQFWQNRRFDSLRDAQLVSYGLTIRPDASKPCILEDSDCFKAVLNASEGVGQWIDFPRRFRRCYQGLMSGYFSYNGRDPQKPDVGQRNWQELRSYLFSNNNRIVDGEFNMDWVDVATKNRSVFTDDPCAAYADAALNGDTETIKMLESELGIGQDSWFQWELIMAQIRYATGLEDEAYKALIPNLLTLISGNEIVREKAMVQILDRYADSAQPTLHSELRDTAVKWWGNPWLPSDEVRWGGVKERTRELVAEWLRRDFIEAFFAKLAKDGVGDKRRANFWLRYVKSMSGVRFGLGISALYSRDRDFQVLREKMKGLYQRLDDPVSSNNAFIMQIGNLVAVEFGGQSNALYGYDARKDLPFDVAKPLQVPVNARNSLKHDTPVRVLWMRHQDDIRGYRRWEDMFEAELRTEFGIYPDDSSRSTGPRRVQGPSAARSTVTSQATRPPPPFSEVAFREFVRERRLNVRDNRAKNGNLRVDASNKDVQIRLILTSWGFNYNEAFQFWWKK